MTVRPRTLTGRARTVVAAGLRAVPVGRLLAPLAAVTPTGWAVAVVGAAGALTAWGAGWVEAEVVAWCSLAVLVMAVAQVLVRSPHAIALSLPTRRVVAGQTAVGDMTVTNRRSRRSGGGVIELPIGTGAGQFLVPPLGARSQWNEVFSVVTRRRGVIMVGPARAVRADALGLVRRVTVWGRPEPLHVHPRTVHVPFDATGFQADTEGVTTARLSSSDVSFHTLRDYEPGDDRRHVHWPTTARLGRLIVRQYEETRRSHHLVVVDTRRGSWSGDDLETALSAAASLALAGLSRSRAVSLRSSGGWVPTGSPVGMLDALAELDTVDGQPLVDTVLQALAERPGTSVLTVVVSPATSDDEAARLTTLARPDVVTGILRIRPQAASRRRRAGQGRIVDCPGLEDLPRVLASGGLS